jgi:hypothetical protein
VTSQIYEMSGKRLCGAIFDVSVPSSPRQARRVAAPLDVSALGAFMTKLSGVLVGD